MKQLKRSKSALLIAALLAASHVAANPTGPTVVRGNVTISNSGNTLTVTNSPGSIINWQGFSLGGQDVTRFQQSSGSAVLNRVTGGNPSTILGQLQSNGSVFLVNPNGVMLGAGAQVNTASFTATTGSVSDNSFVAGTGTPAGGATMTVGGNLNVMGPTVLSGNNVTVEGGLSTPGDLTIIVPGTLTTSGSITATSVTLTNGGMMPGGGSGGGGISVGGGITITTPGGVTPGGNVVLLGGGNSPSAPASAVAASEGRPIAHTVRAMSAATAPVSQALFILEKREPLF